MAKKIEIIGSALVVTDTVSGLILISQPSKDIWYKENELTENNRIAFYDCNGLNGSKIYSDEMPLIFLEDAVDATLVTFTVETFRQFATNFLGYDVMSANGGTLADLGWAQYTDTQYTSGAPLVIAQGTTVTLDINGGSTIKSQLPNGVTDFYDVATSKILGVNSGDGFIKRLSAGIFTNSPSGLAKLKLDIGGAQGVILNRGIIFPKGTGLANANDYTTTNWYYTFGTFLANGGLLQIESVTGDTSVYDISLNIARVTLGK